MSASTVQGPPATAVQSSADETARPPAAEPELLHVARPWVGREEATALAAVIESGWLAQGPRVLEFEQAFAAWIGAAHGVAVSSCTAALHLGLTVLGIRPGDEVVVPSLSFIATANAVVHAGARPIFADVDERTAALTPGTIEPVLGPRTRAVVLVHQGGVPADTRAVREFCASHNLFVLEDAACAAGSTVYGAPVGADSAIAAWSFHPRKVITTGEGGMVTTESVEWAARVRRLREHGMNVSAAERHGSLSPVQESYLEIGFNYRMTDLQAAVGLVQLRRVDRLVAERRWLAGRYQELLAGLPLTCVTDPPYGTTNYQSFWVVLHDDDVNRDVVLDVLAEHRVSGRRGIMAAHLQPAYVTDAKVWLPVTERLTRRSVILPMLPGMTEEQQQRVVEALRTALLGRRL